MVIAALQKYVCYILDGKQQGDSLDLLHPLLLVAKLKNLDVFVLKHLAQITAK